MTDTYVNFFNLSGEPLTLNNSVSPSLNSEYWATPGQINVPSSSTPTQSLVFSRNTGITDGDTWNFTSDLVVDGITVQFQVALTGTVFGSSMEQNLTAGEFTTGWWSSNDTMTLTVEGQSGAIYGIEVSLVVPFPLLSYADFTLTVAKIGLSQNMQLNVGDSVSSASGLLNMTLEPSGLVISRSMFNYPIWTMPNPDDLTANVAVMQSDGNFCVYDASNNLIWQTGVFGEYFILDDNGNLYIMTENNTVIWSSDTPAQDWTAATFQYTENGYSFDETSEYWKQMCQNLPCSMLLQWPDYETTIWNTTLDGQPVVIQAWRGYCEQIMGSSLPGGIGGEVGVYTLQPALQSPATDSWVPMPYVVSAISFQLINLDNGGSVFFESGAENTYWNCKWMTPDSYAAYQQAMGPGNTPPDSDRYQMNLQVTGVDGTQFSVTWPGTI